MARGPKKLLKRVRAPKSGLMHKMGGNFAVRPSQGPHKLRQCIPLQIFLRDKLKLAMNGREVTQILRQKTAHVKIDKHVRRDSKYPIGLMDVVDIPAMNSAWRALYDVKGRWTFLKLKTAEAGFKLCRVQQKTMGPNKIFYIVTHDGRTLRFTDENIKVHDTVRFDLEKKEVTEFYKFQVGNVAFVSDGNNRGRVGVITHIAVFDGSNDIVTLKDAKGHVFSTRIEYVFVIGKGDKPVISLPKGNGLALTIIEEAQIRHGEVEDAE